MGVWERWVRVCEHCVYSCLSRASTACSVAPPLSHTAIGLPHAVHAMCVWWLQVFDRRQGGPGPAKQKRGGRTCDGVGVAGAIPHTHSHNHCNYFSYELAIHTIHTIQLYKLYMLYTIYT